MMPDALSRALAAGATLVTPNKRLARHLAKSWDDEQRAAGKRAWVAARVLPWLAFVVTLEDEAIAAGASPVRVPLSPHATALLWRSAIASDGEPVSDPDAIADAAADAWDHVHAYGAGGESWRGWLDRADEPAAFARWADRYDATLVALRASDVALAAERAARAAGGVPAWHGQRIVLAGFLDPTPQHRRVAAALAGAGAIVEWLPTTASTPARARRASFASTDDELAAAFAWARREVEQRPHSRVGVVVPDLTARRAAVRLRAIDAFGPSTGDDEASMPAWNVSLGAPIDDVPLVAAALDLATLAWSALPTGRAAALLRSPHLPGADGHRRHARAATERRWLEEGVEPARLTHAIAALRAAADPLAERFVAVQEVASRQARTTRHGWVDAWRAAWMAGGWPGERPLSSYELQALRTLDEHLAAFAALDAVTAGRGRGEIAPSEALSSFSTILATSPFQPETPPAPIQILGLYEAIGLAFDALWITGMTDEALPRAPRPHSFLPLAWQREHGVPRSDAARELAYAREVAATLLCAAPDVVVSHAERIDDRPASPSLVFAVAADERAAVVPVTHARAMFDARPQGKRFVDLRAPALVPGTRAGGAGVIQAQSDCPFQALAAHRWGANPWPEPIAGLTLSERGELVHATFAAFWRETRDHVTLVALAGDHLRLAEACVRAAAAAIADVDVARWRRVPRAVRALEEGRLSALLAEWLVDVELGRPPFAVIDVERGLELELGPLTLALRLDRVDRLEGGGVAIIDYKSGRVPSIVRWRGERPQAAQVALYALAWRASQHDAPVRGTVLAQVKRGDAKAIGLYADAAVRIGKPPSRGKDPSVVDDWPALEAEWSGTMRALAEAQARGEAAVAPRELALCRTCARQSLCRIGAAPDDDSGEEA